MIFNSILFSLLQNKCLKWRPAISLQSFHLQHIDWRNFQKCCESCYMCLILSYSWVQNELMNIEQKIRNRQQCLTDPSILRRYCRI